MTPARTPTVAEHNEAVRVAAESYAEDIRVRGPGCTPSDRTEQLIQAAWDIYTHLTTADRRAANDAIFHFAATGTP
jgi:hypothetical protein